MHHSLIYLHKISLLVKIILRFFGKITLSNGAMTFGPPRMSLTQLRIKWFLTNQEDVVITRSSASFSFSYHALSFLSPMLSYPTRFGRRSLPEKGRLEKYKAKRTTVKK